MFQEGLEVSVEGGFGVDIQYTLAPICEHLPNNLASSISPSPSPWSCEHLNAQIVFQNSCLETGGDYQLYMALPGCRVSKLPTQNTLLEK